MSRPYRYAVIVRPDVCELLIHSKTYGTHSVLFDFEKIDTVLDGVATWYLLRDKHTFYAERSVTESDGKRGVQRLHRLIMHTPKHLKVDHINHNGLDCRVENMRNVTNSQNMMNMQKVVPHSSRFKGVNWRKREQKWQAEIMVNGTTEYLGLFTKEEDARDAYNAASSLYHGAFGLCS